MSRPTVSADLEAFVAALMKQARQKDTPLEDQLKIVDRALKLEVLKAKLRNSAMGSAFGDDEKGSEDDE